MVDDTDTHGNYLDYPLVVECLLSSEDAVTLRVAVNADILPTYQAESLCRHFGIVVKQLIEADAKTSIHDISLLDTDDEEQILAWNREAAKNVTLMHHTVPEMFAQIAKSSPTTEAICSSPDSSSTSGFSSWTYTELDAASDRLARHIMSLTDIGPGSLIPLCFEHNAWYVIAVMAVLKAGAAFVPLDPKHPKDRRQEILEQIDAKILLGSPVGVEESVGMVDIIVEVTKKLDHKLRQEQTDISPVQTKVTPLDLAYIIFTSGSTGKPKGVMISHAAVYTSMMNHYEPFGYTPASGAPLRALQFASHVFDASIAEIIGILLYGGTICIPSDAQRMDPQLLADFMTASSISWAFLTPIVAQLLSQIETPTLEVLVCGGELVTATVVRPWVESGVKFITAYG
jgi:non-ribosomal peptide synthetase component F